MHARRGCWIGFATSHKTTKDRVYITPYVNDYTKLNKLSPRGSHYLPLVSTHNITENLFLSRTGSPQVPGYQPASSGTKISSPPLMLSLLGTRHELLRKTVFVELRLQFPPDEEERGREIYTQDQRHEIRRGTFLKASTGSCCHCGCHRRVPTTLPSIFGRRHK